MSKYYKNRKQQSPSIVGNIFTQLGRAVAGIWKLIVGKKSKKLDRAALLAQFNEIEQLLGSGDSIHVSQAVVRADSFLDSVMKQVGATGSTFGERIRNLESRFDRNLYQEIWDAHKLRNQIAHEHPQVTIARAEQALHVFRRAASTLGAF